MSEKIDNCKNIIIIAPFWKKGDHIGWCRVDRFLRWLCNENYNVTIIWSGWKDNIVKTNKWIELEIRDPLRRFTKTGNVKNYDEVVEKTFSFRKFIKKIVFYFDNYFIWSLVLTTKDIVKNACKDTDIIISSSPPESVHLASYVLAKKFSLKLVMDMRDGWIDEPMRKYRGKWSIKKMIERRWELKVLLKASQIFVTSKNWKKLLEERIPIASKKTTILTNAYPIDFDTPENQQHQKPLSSILLLHTGRFLGTRETNKMNILLDPLFKVLKPKEDLAARIMLMGNIKLEELNESKEWERKFSNSLSSIIHKDRIERTEMFSELAKANGLLLLAATKAFFPSKTFEYIKSAKPILAVTMKGSTIWEVGNDLPQMFIFDYSAEELDYTPIEKFLDACRTGSYDYKIPEEFSEEYLSKIFLDKINQIKLSNR